MVWAAVALLLVILAALTYAAYRRDDAAERARISSGSQLATTACGPVEYAEAGSGPPVLVIHGAGGGFDQGMELAQPLVERGFRVVAVSRFGYLRTPLPADASPEAQADAHNCLLEALGVKKAAVIGGSAGAPSGVNVAALMLVFGGALVAAIVAVIAAKRRRSTSSTRAASSAALWRCSGCSSAARSSR